MTLRSNRNLTLSCENLEAREMMAADLGMSIPIATDPPVVVGTDPTVLAAPQTNNEIRVQKITFSELPATKTGTGAVNTNPPATTGTGVGHGTPNPTLGTDMGGAVANFAPAQVSGEIPVDPGAHGADVGSDLGVDFGTEP
ncbi:MAG: hypothetical protein AAGF97_11340 [Planctomycetota bacterium]